MNIKQKTKRRRTFSLILCMCAAFMFTFRPSITAGDSTYEHTLRNEHSSFYMRLSEENVKNNLISIAEEMKREAIEKAVSEQTVTAENKTAENTTKTESTKKKEPQKNNTSAESRPKEDTKPVGKEVTVTATAYCGCHSCNGQWTGYPAADGTALRALHTIAAAESIPFGTKVYIPYFDSYSNGGMFEVHDRGSAITEGRIDIYFDSHEKALEFGMRTLKIYIMQ